MTIASNLQRIVDAKAAIRAAIQDRGVEIPDTEKLDAYHEYIDQITGGGGQAVFEPDLSQVQNAAQLDNLQNIIDAGKAQEYLNLGDELLISYDNTTMPMQVVGFTDATVQKEGEDVIVPAIQLGMKYCATGTTAWGTGRSTYSASAPRAQINNTIKPKFSEDFLNCLGKTKVQSYVPNNDVDVVYDELFIPSLVELGQSASWYGAYAVEGYTFQYYQGADSSKLIKNVFGTTSSQGYWTRSSATNSETEFYVSHKGIVQGQSLIYVASYPIAAFCNFIGKGK